MTNPNAIKHIGLFGSAFDPVHTGHLTVAESAFAQANLDHIIFIPTGHPPHRPPLCATAEHRITMLKLALENFSHPYSISTIECELNRPSFFYQTLHYLTINNPEAKWYIILGWDAYASFNLWKNWQALLNQTTLLVAHRPGTSPNHPQAIQDYLQNHPNCPGVLKIDNPLIPISSTQIRKLLRNNHPIYELPNSVLNYIQSQNLY